MNSQEEDAQTAALQEYFDSNTPAGYGVSFRAGWDAHREYAAADLARVQGETARMREALEDIKLRYDEEGRFASRDMWRVAYEALDALAPPTAPQDAEARR